MCANDFCRVERVTQTLDICQRRASAGIGSSDMLLSGQSSNPGNWEVDWGGRWRGIRAIVGWSSHAAELCTLA